MELELNTFGAILEYGMHLEQQTAHAYEVAAAKAQTPDLATALAELAAEAQKRRQTLARVRRENVTEMILNPIHDFHSTDYAPDWTMPNGDAALRAAALQIESTKERYYDTARAKTELAEAARALRRLAQGNRANADRLGEIAVP